jgi:hypothetical protein
VRTGTKVHPKTRELRLFGPRRSRFEPSLHRRICESSACIRRLSGCGGTPFFPDDGPSSRENAPSSPSAGRFPDLMGRRLGKFRRHPHRHAVFCIRRTVISGDSAFSPSNGPSSPSARCFPDLMGRRLGKFRRHPHRHAVFCIRRAVVSGDSAFSPSNGPSSPSARRFPDLTGRRLGKFRRHPHRHAVFCIRRAVVSGDSAFYPSNGPSSPSARRFFQTMARRLAGSASHKLSSFTGMGEARTDGSGRSRSVHRIIL